MRRIVLLLALGVLYACAEHRPLPAVDPDVLNTVTLCSAGASSRAGVDLTLTAKRNLERTGYEGSFGAALAQEVGGLIMKVNVSDEARVALFKEYSQCVRERSKR